MKRVSQRIYAGETLDICIMHTCKGDIGKKNPRPRERFKNQDERESFNNGRALRRCIRLVNENFTPAGYYITLTFDDENELYNFDDAKKVRTKLRRKLTENCNQDKFIIFMGRGRNTSRIHFHMIYEGKNLQFLLSNWKYGKVINCKHLRVNNIDPDTGQYIGRDYTGLVRYLWQHWTPEQGGQHCMHTRNLRQPTKEPAKEIKRTYSPEKPPKEPKGYKYIKCTANTQYGYQCFHYVIDSKPGSNKKQI